ncbi:MULTISPECIES: alpha,alpha-trehalose-phosphate synthase (UDP-forming) [Rhodomicrobium]|uniref:alpha,alpha-trehalose-phosphate synthase (UDP-forming) n=1 Tax=Rhodomicrobium TaxID=1068 RepID=UPI000B4AB10B|nr:MULTISPECIES: alpha,alpha-trehalose-phosphate synthase (UDP-forming) [Rhodomicrobium]
MSRLVVVSNRVAYLEKQNQSGGLAVALGDALRQTGGVWFGWDGAVVDDRAPLPVSIEQAGTVTIATVPLTEKDYQEYYVGFANQVLWPVCHYRLDLVKFETVYFDGYRRVNARFADALIELLRPDDVIWVHDYHLISLASELRSRGAKQRIGFFLHIPFPPPGVLLAVPVHQWLIKSLFSYDVIGFQTHSDVVNFQRFASETSDGKILSDGRVIAFGRTVIARAFPIGIDVEAFAAMAHTSAAADAIERLNRRNLERKHIVGVDRLDYSKGLPERMKAFRRLLELYPDKQKTVTLMQIAPPTREDVAAYTDIRQELEQLSGSINGEYGDFDWTPVRYIHRNLPRDQLAALFRGSEVGLVTPLRDGMNLVAKEYVAAQDESDPGVLVLSRFAGAAEDLVEALIVNPYDLDDIAHALEQALNMPLDERRARHRALLERVIKHDAAHWREDFLAALAPQLQEPVI